MCILSYVPIEDGFVFTSNRDEKTIRQTMAPEFHKYKNTALFFPKDVYRGGSWIGLNLSKSVVGSILNAEGAYPKERFKKSRGLILLEILASGVESLSIEVLKHVAPFLCILLEFKKNVCEMFYISWDGSQLKNKVLNTSKPHFFCASTLYRESTKTDFENRFMGQINEFIKDPEKIQHFHISEISQKKNSDVYLKKNFDIQTVSMTSFIIRDLEKKFHYNDLLKKKACSGRLN